MFSGAAFEEEVEETGAASGSAPFESIGNLLKQAIPPAAPVQESTPPPVPNAFSGFGPAVTPSKPQPEPSAPVSNGAFAAGFTAFAPASADEPKRESAPASDPFAGFSAAPAEPATPAPFMNPASSVFAPFQNTPPAIPAETPPADEAFSMPTGFGTPAPEPTPTAPADESEAIEEAEVPAPAFTSFTPPREPIAAPVAPEAAPVVDEVPAPAVEPVVEAAVPVVEEEPIVESLPETAAAAPVAPAAAPAIDEELRDLELRAIFSTSESFTFSKVARKVVGLPGINSCSLSAPGKLVQASRREENRLGNEAREMVATLRSLAKLTGLPEARTFTLQTDRGIVSLFLEGDCCVTVHHDSAAFQPGVREKLILVARSLIKLRE